MAGEAAFWDWLRRMYIAQLPPGGIWHHQRIEDLISSGIPDHNLCVQGREYWLELKSLTHWPVRDSTPVRFERYTLEQRDWLRNRWRAGGRSFLVLRVATPGLVLAWNGDVAHSGVEGLPRASLMGTSCGTWECRGFSVRRFLKDLEEARNRG
jgi:hypothetical protein